MLNINTNVASMAARRTLNKNTQALAQSFQRLSTGLRVNSAKDDAAGLVIANRLSAQLRGLNQATRNASDSISMVQTADSALSEQQNMLQRLRELAVQAASDTNTSADRTAIQSEADALISEIDRIAVQTTYNGRNLLDGSLSGVQFQVGAYSNETVSLTIDKSRSFSLGSVYTTTGSTATTAALAAGDLLLNGVAVRATVNSDDQFSTANQSGSAIAKAAAINEGTGDHGVTATVEATTVTSALTAGAMSAGSLVINGVSIGALTVAASDADFALRNAINAASGVTGVVATVSGTVMTLTAADGRNIALTGTGVAADPHGLLNGGAVQTAAISVKETATDGSSGILVTGATTAVAGLATSTITSTRTANVSTLDMTSQAAATTAMDVIDDAISLISLRQSGLGALLNRMDNAISNLSAAAENVAAARSRIQDADFATETAKFSKNQILQQASTAMLAQANVAGQIALQLLG